MQNRLYNISLVFILSLAATACSQTDQIASKPKYHPVETQPQPEPKDKQNLIQGVNIPPEYMPPAGQCRVWYPELPPRQQPPPGKCKQMQKNTPPSAVLIHG